MAGDFNGMAGDFNGMAGDSINKPVAAAVPRASRSCPGSTRMHEIKVGQKQFFFIPES